MGKRFQITFLLCACFAVGTSAQDSFRPQPTAQQQCYKPHKWLPQVSVIQLGHYNLPPTTCEDGCCECGESCDWRGHLRDARDLAWEYRPTEAVPAILSRIPYLDRLDLLEYGIYGRVEYVDWSTDEASVPALVTTSPAGTDQTDAGVLGNGGTSTLFGGQSLFDDSRIGGRFTGGLVIDSQTRYVIEAIYSKIQDDNQFFRTDSSANAIIGRPFLNAQTNAEDAWLVSFPNLADGRITVEASTQMDMFQLALRRNLFKGTSLTTDYVIGYRRAELNDFLRIRDRATITGGLIQGTRFQTTDLFDTENRFDGVDLGVVFEYRKQERLSFEVVTKLALGRTQSEVVVDGSTTTRRPNGTQITTRGGILTSEQGNLVRRRESGFGTMAEVGATMRYRMWDNLHATVGYTLLAWKDVARAGNQIDSSVNPSQFADGDLVGANRPNFRYSDSNWFAQGLTAGLEFRF